MKRKLMYAWSWLVNTLALKNFDLADWFVGKAFSYDTKHELGVWEEEVDE